MSFLTGLHGAVAALLLFVLLFVDEAGVPMPLAPNEVLLVVAGLLVESGALPWFVAYPTALLAIMLGMLVGYGWAHELGPEKLRRVARRVRAERAYDRARQRMLDAGPLAIGITRCIPGVRVYATLVAGAAEVPLPRFLRGAIPAAFFWTAMLMALGVLVGVPAAHVLDTVERVMISGGVLALLGIVAFFAARTAPRRDARDDLLSPFERLGHKLRMSLSVLLDLIVIGVVATGVGRITDVTLHVRFGLDPDVRYTDLVIAGLITIVYLVVSRVGPGDTAGERIFDISYVHPRVTHPNLRGRSPKAPEVLNPDN